MAATWSLCRCPLDVHWQYSKNSSLRHTFPHAHAAAGRLAARRRCACMPACVCVSPLPIPSPTHTCQLTFLTHMPMTDLLAVFACVCMCVCALRPLLHDKARSVSFDPTL